MEDHDSRLMASIYSALADAKAPSFIGFIEAKQEELGLSQRQFAKAIGIELRTFQRILSGEAQKVDVITFLKLSEFLGVDSRELSKLYVAELEAENIRDLGAARRAGFIIRNFDLDYLKKIKFIQDTSSFDVIEERIKKFFGFENIFEYEQGGLKLGHLFSSTKRNGSDKMLHFWCTAAIGELKALDNPYPFDIEQVRHVVAMLSVLTCDEVSGLLNAVRALYRAGVTVIVNPYIGKTQIRGATFIVDAKPCIVLQDYKKKYSTLWFALAHEICHIIKDLDRIRHLKYHISFEEQGDGDIFNDPAIEDRANQFAAEILLPQKHLKYIAGFIDIPGMVKKYAVKWRVSESIIYGQYAYHYKEPRFYSKVISADQAVRHLMIHLYDKESIRSAVEQVQHIYN